MSDTVIRTIPELLQNSVELYGELPALSFVDGDPVTYRDLDVMTRRLGGGLSEMGVKPDHHVAVLGENMPNWGIAYFAISRIGAVVVPVLPDFSPAEVNNIIQHAEVQTIFVTERQFHKIADLHANGTVQAILLDDFHLIPREDTGVSELMPDMSSSVSMLSDSVDSSDVSRQPDDLAAIIYTSGTTGNSKGVMLSHNNIASNVAASKLIPDIEVGQSMLSLLPLSHTYECTLGFLFPIASGACVYYLSKPPSPSVLMPALEKIRPHLMLSVPLFIEKIFRGKVLPKFTSKPALALLYKFRPVQKILHKAAGKKVYAMFGGRLHFFGVGGAALAPDVEKFLRDAGFPYAVGYGLTETSPLVAGCNPKHTVYQSIGPKVHGVEIRLQAGEDNPDAPEVQVNGPNVMKGYYKDELRTKAVFTDDGWFKTGDIGHIDKNGVLSIRGRIKNMILGPSGENIYPEEIEAVINEKPFVEDSLVTKVGDQLVAMVYLNYEALLEHIVSMHTNVKDWHDALQTNVKDGADAVSQGVKQFQSDIEEYLGDLRKKVNTELNAFSRLSDFVLKDEPFEKTPTMKIKRYLYLQ
ncbi:AMP-binding protein [Spirochaeta dissipatitropha]